MLSLQGYFADQGITMSYDDMISDSLLAWNVTGHVRNVELYALDRNSSIYLNVGDVSIDSNFLKGELIAHMPSILDLLIKYRDSFQQENFLKLKIITKKDIEILSNFDVNFAIGTDDILNISTIKTALEEILIREKDHGWMKLSGVSLKLITDSDTPRHHHSEKSRLEKIAAEHRRWNLDGKIESITFSKSAKIKLKVYSDYLDQIGKTNLVFNIDRIVNIDKPKEKEDEFLNLGYNINELIVDSDFFGFKVSGHYFSRLSDKDKVLNYTDITLGIREYGNMIDFISDVINKFITIHTVGTTFTKQDIDQLKNVIPKLWKTDDNSVNLVLEQNGEKEMTISGYTKEEILDAASKVIKEN